MRSLSFLMRPLVGCLLVAALGGNGLGDTFVLSSGARVQGSRASDDESTESHVAIDTAYGGRVRVERSRIVEIISESSAQDQYDRLAPKVADTAEAHFKLARWCGDRQLDEQQQQHLRRVIELDPQHEAAHRALGYSEIGGEWVQREEHLKRNGYVRYKGKWRLAQEVALKEHHTAINTEKKEWFVKLSRWRSQLAGDKRHEALKNIESIRDPMAIEGLGRMLRIERDRRLRLIYVEVLGQIATNDATAALVQLALSDYDEEVYYASLDQLASRQSPPLVRQFVMALRSPNNHRINRAAIALGTLGDQTAVPPLIEALVTRHDTVIPGSDATTSTFSKGGSVHQSGDAFTSGPSAPQVITHTARNQQVLKTLTTLTGVSFGFDQQAWQSWYTLQQRRAQSTAADTRRVD